MTDHKKPDNISNNAVDKKEESGEKQVKRKRHLTLIASNGELIHDPYEHDKDFEPYQCPYAIDDPRDHIRLISDDYGRLIEENIKYVNEMTRYNLMMAELFNAFNIDLNSAFGPHNTSLDANENLLGIFIKMDDKDNDIELDADQIIQLLKLDAKLQKMEQQLKKQSDQDNTHSDNDSINKNNNDKEPQ